MRNDFLSSTMIFPVKDAAETAHFYQEKLGFKIKGIWNIPGYASVTRGDVVIEFGEGRQEYTGSGVCQIQVSDVDEVYQEFRRTDLQFIGELADRDYGNRDFRIRDIDGNMLIVSSVLSTCPTPEGSESN